jgi:hypothetical protein
LKVVFDARPAPQPVLDPFSFFLALFSLKIAIKSVEQFSETETGIPTAEPIRLSNFALQ